MGVVVVEGEVAPEWADAEGVMSQSAYAIAFSRASDSAMAWLGFDPGQSAAADCCVDVAEARHRYLRAMHRGERFRIATHFAAFDGARIGIVHRMLGADGALAAEAEILYSHTRNLDNAPVPFPDATRRRIARIADTPF